MSYRGFKRLLGESSLERKCRFLMGAGTLLLITASFWLYARQTESLAYETTANSGRLLIPQIVDQYHLRPDAKNSLEAFQARSEKLWSQALSGYKFRLYLVDSPFASRPDGDEANLLQEFQTDPNKYEYSRRPRGGEKYYYYYGAVRAEAQCLQCHHHANKAGADMKAGDLMAVVRIALDSRAIEEAVHLNRAILISTALVTSILIMAGSYLIVRYVIVKPVTHLKEVSDSIYAGELNVRSEIQTGDEFEDLSNAFNRMLRNLVSIQEQLRSTNTELDDKVDELARANMALYESNKLKGDFLATMSHELRTPLHSILGFSDVLLTGDGLNDKQNRWVKNIHSSGQQLLDLINDILNLAKIEAGKMEVRPEWIAAGDIAEEAIATLRPVAEKKNLDLQADIAEHLPLVWLDKGKTQQILLNLLSNAIKFTPDRGRIVVTVELDGPELVLKVADTGVGIAPADQSAIFDKFRQAANPLTREHEGTGLGLSIVHELVRLLGGEVQLQSELGKGSTFTVRLPRETAPPPRSSSEFALAITNGASHGAVLGGTN